MKHLVLLFKYLNYYFTSITKHGVHSPFVFDLIVKVFEDKTKYQAYAIVEEHRQTLLKSEKLIEIIDLGAGSRINTLPKRMVADITKNSAKAAKYAQLLYRLVVYFKPKTILELGTSLGITAMYQALGNETAKLYTLEGCVQTANEAQEGFNKLNLNRINLVKGNFDDTLPKVLDSVKVLDYVFFDGNHRYEPTIRYFEYCLKHVHNDSVFIFDDIHWSKEMEAAWHYIKNHDSVKVSIDLFFIGIVFFRKEQIKQHFTIRY